MMSIITGNKKEKIFPSLKWLRLNAVMLVVVVVVVMVQPVWAVAPKQNTTDFTAFYMGSDTAESCLSFNPFTLSDNTVSARRTAIRTAPVARTVVNTPAAPVRSLPIVEPVQVTAPAIKLAPVTVPRPAVVVSTPKPTVVVTPKPVVVPEPVAVVKPEVVVAQPVRQSNPVVVVSPVSVPTQQVVSVSYNPEVVEVVKPAVIKSVVTTPATRPAPVVNTTPRVTVPAAPAATAPVTPVARRTPVRSVPAVSSSNTNSNTSGRGVVAPASSGGRRPALRIPYRPPLRSPYQLPPRP